MILTTLGCGHEMGQIDNQRAEGVGDRGGGEMKPKSKVDIKEVALCACLGVAIYSVFLGVSGIIVLMITGGK